MSQTYPRYGARDFERRWQTRLNTPPRQMTNNASQLHVEVTHRFPAPNRYGWELRPVAGLSVEESQRSQTILNPALGPVRESEAPDQDNHVAYDAGLGARLLRTPTQRRSFLVFQCDVRTKLQFCAGITH